MTTQAQSPAVEKWKCPIKGYPLETRITPKNWKLSFRPRNQNININRLEFTKGTLGKPNELKTVVLRLSVINTCGVKSIQFTWNNLRNTSDILSFIHFFPKIKHNLKAWAKFFKATFMLLLTQSGLIALRPSLIACRLNVHQAQWWAQHKSYLIYLSALGLDLVLTKYFEPLEKLRARVWIQ